jgi:hypothetical protein
MVGWSVYDGWWTGPSAVVPFFVAWMALSASQSLVHLVEDLILPE